VENFRPVLVCAVLDSSKTGLIGPTHLVKQARIVTCPVIRLGGPPHFDELVDGSIPLCQSIIGVVNVKWIM